MPMKTAAEEKIVKKATKHCQNVTCHFFIFFVHTSIIFIWKFRSVREMRSSVFFANAE